MTTIRFTVLAFAACTLIACNASDNGSAVSTQTAPEADSETPEVAAPQEAQNAMEELPVTEIVPGLTMKRLKEGDGAAAAPGQRASVHYTGWLFDPTAPDNRGSKFDSSVDRGEPFAFPIGAGQVIQGWDQGVAGMLVGEARELTIAPDLAYGNRAIGDLIPPGSTLVFEVELLGLSGEPAAE